MQTKEINELAEQWRYESTHGHIVWLNRSLILNVALLILLSIASMCLLMLLPLKEKVPYLLSQNQATGEIAQVGELNRTDFKADWTLTRHFIVKYITSREEYHSDDIDRPYQLTYAMSAPSVATEYAQKTEDKNPASPLNIYGDKKFVTVNIHSIAKLNDNTAEVHFEKIVHEKGLGSEHAIPVVAIVKWHFVDETVTQKMLDRNPLGFKVTYYHPTQVNLNK